MTVPVEAVIIAALLVRDTQPEADMNEWCARERDYFPPSEFETDADGYRVHVTERPHWAVTGALVGEREKGPAPTDVMGDAGMSDGGEGPE